MLLILQATQQLNNHTIIYKQHRYTYTSLLIVQYYCIQHKSFIHNHQSNRIIYSKVYKPIYNHPILMYKHDRTITNSRWNPTTRSHCWRTNVKFIKKLMRQSVLSRLFTSIYICISELVDFHERKCLRSKFFF